MKIYKLKQKYPNSPEIGFVVNATQSEYYDYKPWSYPHLWECFESDKTMMSVDNELAVIGDKVYFEYNNRVQSMILSEQTIAGCYYENKIYKHDQNCQNYINSLIDVQIENEHIVGENIDLYGVCVTNQWIKGENTTFRIFDRPSSTNWKYFRTESQRDSYIELNKPQYTKKELLDLVEEVIVYKWINDEGNEHITESVIKLKKLQKLFELKETK